MPRDFCLHDQAFALKATHIRILSYQFKVYYARDRLRSARAENHFSL